MLGKKSVLTLAVVAGMVALAFQPWRDASSGQEPKHAGDQVAKLGKERVLAAGKAYSAWHKQWTSKGDSLINERPFGMIYDLSVRWLNAELDVEDKKDERISAYARHLDRMKFWAAEWNSMEFQLEGMNKRLIAQAAQKEAEHWLAKERQVRK